MSDCSTSGDLCLNLNHVCSSFRRAEGIRMTQFDHSQMALIATESRKRGGIGGGRILLRSDVRNRMRSSPQKKYPVAPCIERSFYARIVQFLTFRNRLFIVSE